MGDGEVDAKRVVVGAGEDEPGNLWVAEMLLVREINPTEAVKSGLGVAVGVAPSAQVDDAELDSEGHGVVVGCLGEEEAVPLTTVLETVEEDEIVFFDDPLPPTRG